MENIEDTPIWVDGHMTVGNFTCGRVSFSGTVGSPVSVAITGLELTGTGDVYVQLTSESRGPVVRGYGSGYVCAMYSNPSPTGFTIYSVRLTGTSHSIFYMAYRDP